MDVRPSRNTLMTVRGQSNALIYIPMLEPTQYTIYARQAGVRRSFLKIEGTIRHPLFSSKPG